MKVLHTTRTKLLVHDDMRDDWYMKDKMQNAWTFSTRCGKINLLQPRYEEWDKQRSPQIPYWCFCGDNWFMSLNACLIVGHIHMGVN